MESVTAATLQAPSLRQFFSLVLVCLALLAFGESLENSQINPFFKGRVIWCCLFYAHFNRLSLIVGTMFFEVGEVHKQEGSASSVSPPFFGKVQTYKTRFFPDDPLCLFALRPLFLNS